MDFSELLLKRRSIRDFKDKDVPMKVINEIIEDSIKAPNSQNLQPWSFIIIQNRDLIKKLSDSSRDALIRDIEQDPDPARKPFLERIRNSDMNVFYNAPCLIYIVGGEDVRSLEVDVGLLAAYFMLSASSRGLGTCWIGMGSYVRDKDLVDAIGLPEGCRIVAPIILGYPAGIIPDMNPRVDPNILKVVAK